MLRSFLLLFLSWLVACVDTVPQPTPATTVIYETTISTQKPTQKKTQLDQDGDGFTQEVDCDDLNSLINPGAEELCDGTDNNCDGKTDEVWKHAVGPSVGKQCAITTKIGCTSFGYWVCHPDKSALLCNAELREPLPESCNNVDDDCDGETDEDFPDLHEFCRTIIDNCFVFGTTECNLFTGQTYCTVEDISGVDEDCSPVR